MTTCGVATCWLSTEVVPRPEHLKRSIREISDFVSKNLKAMDDQKTFSAEEWQRCVSGLRWLTAELNERDLSVCAAYLRRLIDLFESGATVLVGGWHAHRMLHGLQDLQPMIDDEASRVSPP